LRPYFSIGLPLSVLHLFNCAVIIIPISRRLQGLFIDSGDPDEWSIIDAVQMG
jgi:hypothetical protein